MIQSNDENPLMNRSPIKKQYAIINCRINQFSKWYFGFGAFTTCSCKEGICTRLSDLAYEGAGAKHLELKSEAWQICGNHWLSTPELSASCCRSENISPATGSKWGWHSLSTTRSPPLGAVPHWNRGNFSPRYEPGWLPSWWLLVLSRIRQEEKTLAKRVFQASLPSFVQAPTVLRGIGLQKLNGVWSLVSPTWSFRKQPVTTISTHHYCHSQLLGHPLVRWNCSE